LVSESDFDNIGLSYHFINTDGRGLYLKNKFLK